MACSLAGLSLWAIATGAVVRSDRVRRLQERVMSAVLLALGLKVAFTK